MRPASPSSSSWLVASPALCTSGITAASPPSDPRFDASRDSLLCVLWCGLRLETGRRHFTHGRWHGATSIGIQDANRQADRSVSGPAQVRDVRQPAIRVPNVPHAGMDRVLHDLQQDTIAVADRPNLAVTSPVQINLAEDVTGATVLAHANP